MMTATTSMTETATSSKMTTSSGNFMAGPRGPTAILLLEMVSKFSGSNLHEFGLATYPFLIASSNDRFKFGCPHQHNHTYEKSDLARDSWVALLRGVQAVLTILSRSLCLSSIFSSILSFFLVGLNAAITYSRVQSAFKGPLRRLPIHTPDRCSVMWFSGLPTTRNTHTLELMTFHPFTHFPNESSSTKPYQSPLFRRFEISS